MSLKEKKLSFATKCCKTYHLKFPILKKQNLTMLKFQNLRVPESTKKRKKIKKKFKKKIFKKKVSFTSKLIKFEFQSQRIEYLQRKKKDFKK
jgi:hypothetical protein